MSSTNFVIGNSEKHFGLPALSKIHRSLARRNNEYSLSNTLFMAGGMVNLYTSPDFFPRPGPLSILVVFLTFTARKVREHAYERPRTSSFLEGRLST